MADKKSTAATWTANQRGPIPVRVKLSHSPEELAAMIENVDTNPTKVVFPTDQWGFTSDLKKAVLLAAGTVQAQQDKHDLLLATLGVLMNHIRKRKATDEANKEARTAWRQEQAEHTLARTRQYGIALSPADPVIL